MIVLCLEFDCERLKIFCSCCVKSQITLSVTIKVSREPIELRFARRLYGDETRPAKYKHARPRNLAS